ncbi:S8 family serine peptidase [Granulosicoccus antarcticus]|uniref:S8 family serine peptidase n=1 Tax=Granulosicoccus antarcticus TaxID=437505 RepID=UPI00146FA344|nr:S8 family serine peptidase [Granulosicoccus antarcticus]
MTDETFGHYDEDLEPNLILITMTPERHAFLTGMKSVPMSGDLPPRYSDFLNQMQSRYGLKRVANWPLPAIEIFCVVFEVENAQARKTIVAALEQEPGVETAQIVQTFEVKAENYNDPYLGLQHGFHSLQAISSHQWSRGKGVTVAVVDTGMDNTHPDLVLSSEATRNFVDSDDAKFRSDTHGTAVGGVIAASADNDTGMVGIAPEANLLALKACWHVNQGESKARCNSLTLAKAINYSILQNVDIINLSLTGPPDPVLERLVLAALERGIVVIGAVPAHENRAFPVSIQGTIAVDMPGNKSKSISAPGRRVLSTLPDNKYAFFDGSSFSTAHITGLAALLRSVSPTLSPSELLALLELTANLDTGAVNACRAVDMARRLSDEIADQDNCLLAQQ